MDPLPRRRKEGGGEIVEVYGFAGWIASLVAYGEQAVALATVCGATSAAISRSNKVTHNSRKPWCVVQLLCGKNGAKKNASLLGRGPKPIFVFIAWMVCVVRYVFSSFFFVENRAVPGVGVCA